MSSAETPRFDASAAARQMLDLDRATARAAALPAQAQSSPAGQPSSDYAVITSAQPQQQTLPLPQSPSAGQSSGDYGVITSRQAPLAGEVRAAGDYGVIAPAQPQRPPGMQSPGDYAVITGGTGAAGPGGDYAVITPALSVPLPSSLSDRGNAKLFVELYRDQFRHVEGLGWYAWDGYRWKRAGGEKAALWAAGEMAEQLPDSDPRGLFNDRELHRHKRRTLSTTGMKALLTQAKASPHLSVDPDTLDGDPYALCTPAGIVDLNTGLLRKPDPTRDFHSRATSVAPQHGETPRWHRFLADTFGDDAEGREMIDFLHLLLGYSITGDVGAQVLPFLHGHGKNGKSVLLDTMIQILGDYADAAPPGFLMDRGAFSEHSTELTELHGRRLIVCSELKPNDKFDEARVRLLTGGDKIKARRMRQDYFSFTPTHHLWLLGNHRPEVTTGGFAFWRRIRLLPFERTVPEHRKIDNLAFELVRDEGPGILQWLIDGARRYLTTRDSLEGPDRVRIATTAYANTEDHIGRFLTECCTRDLEAQPDLRVEQGLLYTAYVAWCSAGEGIRPAGARAFATRVRQEVGLASPADMIKSNGRKYYPRLALLDTHS